MCYVILLVFYGLIYSEIVKKKLYVYIGWKMYHHVFGKSFYYCFVNRLLITSIFQFNNIPKNFHYYWTKSILSSLLIFYIILYHKLLFSFEKK